MAKGRGCLHETSQNQHQPSRGITTDTFHKPTNSLNEPESTSTQSRDYNLWTSDLPSLPRGARININPVEGLQQKLNTLIPLALSSQNQHQPSRGITTAMPPTMISWLSGQNQHQPNRGITTAMFPRSAHLQRCQNQHQPSRGITTSVINSGLGRSTSPESTSTQSRDYNFYSARY